MAVGLTLEGLVVPTLGEIREALNESLRAAFGASIDLGDKSVLGQIVGIIAERLSSLWERLEAVNSSQDPDKAVGTALDALCALTGTFRPAAAPSTTVLSLTGTPTTVVPAGSRTQTASTEKVFVTQADDEIVAVPAWVAATAYVVGDRVTSSTNVYVCITAGTSHATTGPSAETEDVTDNTVHWRFIGDGTGVVDTYAESEETGVITALSGDITVILSPFIGWDSVKNLEDADPGRDEANDGELRQLREDELATGGNSTVDALRAELLEVEDVRSVSIFVNNTDVTDADGVPPHSVEALVRIPTGAEFDQRIWDALLAGVAAGIRTHGDEVGTATDDEGTAHVMKYTRPDEVDIHVIMNVTVDAELFPSDGVALIKQAVVDFGDNQETGKNAVSSSVSAQAFAVSGVIDVVDCFIDDAPAPASEATVAISLRQLAVFDTSRITVNITPGTP